MYCSESEHIYHTWYTESEQKKQVKEEKQRKMWGMATGPVFATQTGVYMLLVHGENRIHGRMFGDMESIIRQNYAFSHLAESELQALSAAATTRIYPKNSYIFWQNDRINDAFIIDRGLVRLYRSHPSGRTKTVSLKSSGDLVSIYPLMFPYSHKFTAHVLSKSVIVCFPIAVLNKIADVNNAFYEALRQMISQELNTELMEIENRIFMNINGCLAFKLVQLADKFGRPNGKGTLINLTLSHQQLADMLGTNRETVCKEMNLLRQIKAIAVENRQITILDREKLHAIQ